MLSFIKKLREDLEEERKFNLEAFHERLAKEIEEHDEKEEEDDERGLYYFEGELIDVNKDPRFASKNEEEDDDVDFVYETEDEEEDENVAEVEKTETKAAVKETPKADPDFKAVYKVLKKVPNINFKKTKIVKDDKTSIYTLILSGKDGKKRKFHLDNGSLLGGTMLSIMFDLENDDFFIPVKDEYEDILVKGLSGNLITEEDVNKVKGEFLPNLALYGAFDFSNTEKLDEIKKSGDDFNKFNNILSIIYDNNLFLAKGNIGNMMRMRFAEFKDYNDFIVVSDDKVSPALETKFNNVLQQPINNGEKYVVNKNGIFRYMNGEIVWQSPLVQAPRNAETPIVITNYTAMPNPYYNVMQAAM